MKTTIHTATTCMILAGLLSTADAQDNIGRLADIGEAAPTDHKPAGNTSQARELADFEITGNATEFILNNQEAKTTLDKLNAAFSIKSLEEAAKHLNRASMEAIDENIDFEKEKLVVFAWQGSGQDSLRTDPSSTKKDHATFLYTLGHTKDLKTHVKIYALPKDSKWTINTIERIHFKCGNDANGIIDLNFEGAPGMRPKFEMKINGQPVPIQPQAQEE